MTVLVVLSGVVSGLALGWTARSLIADLEHDWRWHEGCRHNIEERWWGAWRSAPPTDRGET